ncbi:MAG: hypothetical protein M0C28_22700 [Candidatus Moduliflexus flocculans]|nr:hypothetical protein [Candidatus Moduliflexus flocculans]
MPPGCPEGRRTLSPGNGPHRILGRKSHGFFIRPGTGRPLPLRPVTLVLGFPRPIQVARILKDLCSLGVRRILMAATDLGEKSYAESSDLQGAGFPPPPPGGGGAGGESPAAGGGHLPGPGRGPGGPGTRRARGGSVGPGPLPCGRPLREPADPDGRVRAGRRIRGRGLPGRPAPQGRALRPG